MGLFGPSRPLSKDELEWQLAAFRWLIEEAGGLEQLGKSCLAHGDGEYFPDSSLTGHARAEELLAEVKAIADMADWPTRLIALPRAVRSEQVGDYLSTVPESNAPLGTFQAVDDGEGGWLAEIRFDPAQLDDPAKLVATFAHELAHYLLATIERPFPGGDDVHELMTDITAVWLGFGIFLANSARHYSASNLAIGGHRWQSRSQGYLSERALVTAMVASDLLAGRDPDEARRHLKPYLRQDLDLAMKWFARRDIHADVAAVDLADYGAARDAA
ncbi:MAG: hypothetical protein K2X31_10375 [Sphingopyxis sp.]|nr:hypothetical protein [Sphingopyxis sp.]